MRNNTDHAKFDFTDIQGTMTLAIKVEIINIHHGGVALKADGKLDVGREYTIKLGDEGQSIDVNGIVVRCNMVGTEPTAEGKAIFIYAAGMRFIEGSEDKITAFLNSVEHHVNEKPAQAVERRRAVRYQIAAPPEKVIHVRASFKVKDITLSNMLIQSDQSIEQGSMVPLELSLNENDRLNFTGKVLSCRTIEERGRSFYEIKVTYPDLADNSQAMIEKLIDRSANEQ